ncbi:unnamed protein product [Ectocarpus sp. 4 AP-2014]
MLSTHTAPMPNTTNNEQLLDFLLNTDFLLRFFSETAQKTPLNSIREIKSRVFSRGEHSLPPTQARRWQLQTATGEALRSCGLAVAVFRPRSVPLSAPRDPRRECSLVA